MKDLKHYGRYVGFNWAKESVAQMKLPCTHLLAEFFHNEYSIQVDAVTIHQYDAAVINKLLSPNAGTQHPSLYDWVTTDVKQHANGLVMESGIDKRAHTGILLNTPSGWYVLHAVYKVGGMLTPYNMLECQDFKIVQMYRHKELSS